jgi:glycosyltransferase involved in cell wall biosynthesis
MMPSVSIITPTTKSREQFMPQLLQMVAMQDYPHIEHVIVDDEGLTVGRKRNMACERATGDIILHMDSDDIYANDWVSRSVGALLVSNADMVGISQLYFRSLVDEKVYKFTYQTKSKKPWVAGATMCYWKRLWETWKFRDIVMGEDTMLIRDSGCVVHDHGYYNGFLSSIHSDNTSPRKIADSRYSLCDAEVLSSLPLLQ